MEEFYSICSYFYKGISKIISDNSVDFVKVSPTHVGLNISIDSEELCIIKVGERFINLESKMKVVDGILCSCSPIKTEFEFSEYTVKSILEKVLYSIKELIATVPKEME